MSYDRAQLFLGGQWRDPTSTEVISVVSPVTEETIGSAPQTTRAELDEAVSAARRALPAWAALGTAGRAEIIGRFADALERRSGATAALVTAENGMPIALSSTIEGPGPAGILRYFANVAQATPDEERRTSLSPFGGTTVVRRDPVGVVGAIVPWNFPQSLIMFKLAPALAAGCTFVLKPAPGTVLDAFQLADAAVEAGLPAGVLSVVTGDAEIGSALVAHRGVDKVCFTGSTEVGRAIAETCGRLLKPVTLELGGKSAAIVLDDADLAATVAGLATASLLHAGQICYACTRILAPRSRYDEVVDAVAELASSLPVGDPSDFGTAIGPLTSQRQRARVEDYIAIGKTEARLVAGGGRPDGLDKGWYVQPTVFADVDNSDRIAREEIFGPVLSVIPYGEVDEAIGIANDSDYGLGGTIWTSDIEKGLAIARRVQTGSVGVNHYFLDLGAPFGGVKGSGVGRELGPEGLATFHTLKSVYLPADAVTAVS